MQDIIVVKIRCTPKNQTNMYRLHKLHETDAISSPQRLFKKEILLFQIKMESFSPFFCTNCLHLMIPEYRNTNINFLGKALSFLHLSVAKTAITYFSTFVLSILHPMVVGITTFSRRHGDYIEWKKLHLSAVLTQGCQIYSS